MATDYSKYLVPYDQRETQSMPQLPEAPAPVQGGLQYGPLSTNKWGRRQNAALPDLKHRLVFGGPLSELLPTYEKGDKDLAIVRVNQPPSDWAKLPEGEREQKESDAKANLTRWELATKIRSIQGDWAANYILGVTPEYLESLPDRRVPKEYQGVTRTPEGKWINIYGVEVPEPPEEFMEDASLSPIQKVGEFVIGDFLGRPDHVAEMILSGDPNNIHYAIDGLIKDLALWAPFVGPVGKVTMKAAGAAIKAAVKAGATPPRLIYRAVQKLIPEPLRPSHLLEGLWESVVVPSVRARFIPSYGEGAKSIAEIFQPAVERLAEIPFGKGTLGSPFRNKAAMEGVVSDIGKELGRVVGAARPSLRHEIARAFAGVAPESEEGKAVWSAYRKRLKGADLRQTYETYYHKGIEQATKRHKVGTGPQWEMYESHPGVDDFLGMLDENLGGVFKPRNVTKALKTAIENPTLPRGMRELARDLYDLPANTVEMVGEASRYAGRHFLFDRLKNTGQLQAHLLPDQNPADFMISKIPELKQAWLPRDVELELRALETIPKIARGVFNKFLMTPWKVNKLMLRPATHMRNIPSNIILNDWGGLPFYRMDYYVRSLKEMMGKSKNWNEWNRLTGGGGTFTKAEAGQVAEGMKYNSNAFDAALSMFDRITAPAKSLYGAEEQWAKMAKFLWNKDKGMTPLAAAQDAMKWTFNYGEVTRTTARIRGFAAPFFTWQSKVLPLMAETAVKHPVRMFKWVGFYMGLQEAALGNLKISDNEWSFIESILPEYIREGQYLLIPWRDSKDRLQLLNLTYMMPGFGDLNEMAANPVTWAIGNPMISCAGALMYKRKFGGAPLYHEWEEPSVKFMKATSYMWQQLLPSWLPPYGIDWDKAWDTVTDHPDALTYNQIIGMNLGMKISPINVAKTAKRQQALDRIHKAELGSQMKRELREAKGPKEVERIIRRYNKLKINLQAP